MCNKYTYRKQESVLEVWELPVALLAAVQPVVLIDDFLVAVCRWTGLVETCLLAGVQQRRYAAKIVRLRGESQMEQEKFNNVGRAACLNLKKKPKTSKSHTTFVI